METICFQFFNQDHPTLGTRRGLSGYKVFLPVQQSQRVFSRVLLYFSSFKGVVGYNSVEQDLPTGKPLCDTDYDFQKGVNFL